ncbi:unnamed protein product [Commensalibacter communis]|nr:unnamed protein product [Commensalibacter communis]
MTLERFFHAQFKNCVNLNSAFYNVKKLRFIRVCGCSSFEEFPDTIAVFYSLRGYDLSEIINLKRLIEAIFGQFTKSY